MGEGAMSERAGGAAVYIYDFVEKRWCLAAARSQCMGSEATVPEAEMAGLIEAHMMVLTIANGALIKKKPASSEADAWAMDKRWYLEWEAKQCWGETIFDELANIEGHSDPQLR